MAPLAPKPRPGVLDIEAYVPGESKVPGGLKPIKLSSNETPLGPSPKAVAAFTQAGAELERYPDGQAAALREEAAAYANRVVQEATGEAERFNAVYAEYVNAPEVTRKRLFLETMEQVLGASEKVLVENGAGGSGVVPYLPLPELRSRTTTTTGAGE